MEEILKNLNDSKAYRVITLSNELKCLLISDPSKEILRSIN